MFLFGLALVVVRLLTRSPFGGRLLPAIVLLFRFTFVVILLLELFPGFALDSFLLRLAFQGFQLGEGRYRPFPDDALAGPLWVTVMPGAAIANIFSAGSAIVLLTTAAAVPSTAIS